MYQTVAPAYLQNNCWKSECWDIFSKYTPCYFWHKSSYSPGLYSICLFLAFALLKTTFDSMVLLFTGWVINGTWSFFGWSVTSRNGVLLAGWVRYSSLSWSSVRTFLYDGEYREYNFLKHYFFNTDMLLVLCFKCS